MADTTTRSLCLAAAAAAAVLALACGPARADDVYGEDGYDANHDGYVSFQEWRRLGGEPHVFTGSDANHDGRLDGDELVKAMSWDARIKAAEYAGDAWTTAKVKAMLLLATEVNGPAVSVTTHDGTVRLSGDVSSVEEARTAVRLALQVEGVRNVVNALKVTRAVAAHRP